MKLFWIASILALLIAAEAQFSNEGCYGEGNVARSVKVADKAEYFAMDFFYRMYGKSIVGNSRPKSFVVSPNSAWSVLVLAYLGSGGQTEAQLRNALNVKDKNEAFYGSRFTLRRLESYKGTKFNSLNKGYFAPFLEVKQCSKIHQYELLNFSRPSLAARKINDDVNRTTHGKIPKLFGPNDLANAVFVLLNAIYFKGPWVNQFNHELTRDRVFHDQYGRGISQTPMMETFASFKYADIEALEAEVIELPYENSEISMLIILPHLSGSKDNLDIALRRVAFKSPQHDALKVILSSMTERPTRVVLPKFKLETTIQNEFKSILMDMDIQDMFNQDAANFTGFTRVKPMFVSDAIQKIIIEVNEEGTVAAAATALVGTRSGAKKHAEFIADRPFIFLLRDMGQGLTLFSGFYANPNDATST